MTGFVIISAFCPLCQTIMPIIPTLQEKGYRVISLGEKDQLNLHSEPRWIIHDLLSMLQVESLPAIKDEQGVIRCGNEVISWAETQGFNVVPITDIKATRISDLPGLIYMRKNALLKMPNERNAENVESM